MNLQELFAFLVELEGIVQEVTILVMIVMFHVVSVRLLQDLASIVESITSLQESGQLVGPAILDTSALLVILHVQLVMLLVAAAMGQLLHASHVPLIINL